MKKAAPHIFNEERDPGDMNNMLIKLILKINSLEKPKDFRPISLSNVIMKIVTKAIANRIKKLLPLLIGETQITFIPWRLIINNALIAYKAFHYLKKKRSDRK